MDQHNLVRPTTVETPTLDMVLLRKDGVLVMGNKDIMMKSGGDLVPYNGSMGPPEPTRQDLLLYLAGHRPGAGGTAAEMVGAGRVDITRLNLAELKEYAMDEFGLDCSAKGLTKGQVLMKIIERRDELEAIDRKNGRSVEEGLGLS